MVLPTAPVLVTVTRSGRVESVHRGAVAIWHGEQLVGSVGAVAAPVFARSATKPLQALPLLERGLHRQLGLTPGEIAVLCASHVGMAEHIAAVRSVLEKAGMHEEQLGCGPQAPFDSAARRELLAAGQRPLRVHNNCSGKHAGFLALAAACSVPLAEYLQPECRAQQQVREAVAAMCEVAEVGVGMDGCGAPTFWLPLAQLARGFLRLANPAGLPDVRQAACQTILAAAAAAPRLLEGPGRLGTELAICLPGQCFGKNGAEGVYAVGIVANAARARFPGPLGLAVKIEDGSQRAVAPVVLAALQWLGVLPHELPTALRELACSPVRNTQQLVVGEIACALDFAAGTVAS